MVFAIPTGLASSRVGTLPPGGGGTLGISGWGCTAGTLGPLTYTRASSAEFCYPILHSGQTSELCKSSAKYFKVKVATFTIERLGYYQHPVSLLNFLKVY